MNVVFFLKTPNGTHYLNTFTNPGKPINSQKNIRIESFKIVQNLFFIFLPVLLVLNC